MFEGKKCRSQWKEKIGGAVDGQREREKKTEKRETQRILDTSKSKRK